jgi:hypothetical protein
MSRRYRQAEHRSRRSPNVEGCRSEKEIPVNTLLVTMSVDPSRAGLVAQHLREDIVPWAQQQRGFVSGQWLLGAGQGFGVVLFETGEDAQQAAAGPRAFPYDESRAWNIVEVQVYERVAAA